MSQMGGHGKSLSSVSVRAIPEIQEVDEPPPTNLLKPSSILDMISEYDGLIGLDESRLNNMVETDLISNYY